MPQKITARNWLMQNNYEDIACLIDTVMNGWRAKGAKTRRNWWDVLAGCKDGNPRVIGGISFPVLSAAQIRNGIPVTVNAICRNENEQIPQKMTSGRWISE